MRVAMKGISKAFGPVHVLDGVDFAISGGEIHALMGENGAGKSTLMKILSGVYTPDAGAIEVDGRRVTIRSTNEAEALGIAIIHQELNLIPQLSAMENLFLGREPSRFGIIDRRRMQADASHWLSRVGASHIDSEREAGSLRVGEQQLVEIARALSMNARVLIMDEPTAALTDPEIETLFRIMAGLKADGVAIVYVSHRMDEIFRICDRISVLRDGHFVGERLVRETSFNEIVKLMVGRELHERFPARHVDLGAVRIEVVDSAGDASSSHIHFQVRAGEVMGVAGLMGAGRSAILRALFGLDSRKSWRVILDGVAVSIQNPRDAIAAGIGFVTEDRKSQGLVMDLSVRENATLVHLRAYARLGIVNKKAENQEARKLIDSLHIRTRDAELDVRSLSGGNQQKVVFAKWLVKPPKVLLLDEPTRGVDVGGKAEIYGIINRLADAGTAIVMVSSELPEVLAMSDRILVMNQGRQAAILDARATSQEEIMANATTSVLLEQPA